MDTEQFLKILVTAVIGGVFGGVATTALKYGLDRMTGKQKRHEEAKILAGSLRGEIRSIRDHMKIYRRATNGFIRRNMAADFDGESQHDGNWTAGMRFDLEYFSHIETPVFDKNIGQIGLLWGLLTKEIVEFYSDLSVLKIFSSRTVKSTNNEVFQTRVKLFYDECDSLVQEATSLNKRIRSYAVENKYPEKRSQEDVRKKYLIGQKSSSSG
jgi:hypothetical protein